MEDLKTYTTVELAKILNLSPRYLRKLRSIGGGPEFIRLSIRKCVYPASAISAWVKARKLKSNADDRAQRMEAKRTAQASP